MGALLILAAKIKPVDVVIILLAVAAVVGVCLLTYFRKKKGVSSCGCGCSTCPHAGACASHKGGKTPETKRETAKENSAEND